jgi:hypothetical protein
MLAALRSGLRRISMPTFKRAVLAVVVWVSVIVLSPITQAQNAASVNYNSSPNPQSAETNSLVDEAREDASNFAIDFAFDHLDYLKLDPSTNAFAPHVNYAIDTAQNLYTWSGVAQEAIQLTYPMQPADLNYQANKFTFDAGVTLVGIIQPASAEITGGAMGLYDLHEKWRDLNQQLIAQDHQRETQTLAFGGVLSTTNLPRISFAPSPVDLTSGGSFRSDPNDRLSITGVWVAHNDVTFDRFDAASRYAFNGLETPSGQILTGYGIASRERVELNQPFSLSSLFETRDTTSMTESTRRFESYNESFNGALANQAIQQSTEFNHRPDISVHVDWSLPTPQNQDIVKRPPNQFLPPPEAPRPLPNAVGNDDHGSNSPAQVKGVLMPANVTTRPVDVQEFLGD